MMPVIQSCAKYVCVWNQATIWSNMHNGVGYVFNPMSSSERTFGLLICTLISENQGLEKLRSDSNLRKISGPAHLDFFSVCHLDFFQVYGINLAFFLSRDLEKKSRFAGPEIFLRFETDLNFTRPWFLEIKVQIKRPKV